MSSEVFNLDWREIPHFYKWWDESPIKVKAIVSKKTHLQFIFATHNANIPVSGDSERVFVVNYQDATIDISKGNIDCDVTQHQIVEIMEGGQEAFHKRQLIYNAWNK